MMSFFESIKNYLLRFKTNHRRKDDLFTAAHSTITAAKAAFDLLFADDESFVDPLEKGKWESAHGTVFELFDELCSKKYRKDPDAIFLKHDLQDLKEAYNSFDDRVQKHNETTANLRAAHAKEIIGKVEGRVLDQQQMACIVKEMHNHLVIAGAGTGKTTVIVGKIKYLLATKKLPPNEILVLSFTNASASQIRKRILAETGAVIDALTFHKLGINIISKASGIVPKVSKIDPKRFVAQKLTERSSSVAFYSKLALTYLSLKNSSEPSESYFDYSENSFASDCKLTTIKNETVKSRGELDIANFLALNGIEYRYESPYFIDTRTGEFGQYYPDFYLPKHNTYIEYFGVDKYGNVPSSYDAKHGTSAKESYNASIVWKRELHRKYNTALIECYAYERQDGSLLDSLERKLRELSVEFSPVSKTELEKEYAISEHALHSVFTELFSTLINLLKSNDLNPDDLRSMLTKKGLIEDFSGLLGILTPIFNSYNSLLAKNGEIDFNDMINNATRLVRTQRYKNPYSLVIVDEYQDISKARYNLLAELRKTRPFDLFCVGDDWQSIYRFSGSDIGYILEFARYWGPSEISKIETTYRFPSDLIRISGEFIMKNPSQIKKQLRANNASEGSSIEVLKAYSENFAVKKLTNELRELPAHSSVFLIGRYNYDCHILPSSMFRIHYDAVTSKVDVSFLDRPDLDISFLTAHRSKGLQADYVFILNNKASNGGFPSGPRKLPLADMLLEIDECYPAAEERRLYYVALTRAKKKVFLLLTSPDISSFAEEVMCTIKGKKLKVFRYCPKCGGKLILRSGEFGEFFACSNYASKGCRFKLNVNRIIEFENE